MLLPNGTLYLTPQEKYQYYLTKRGFTNPTIGQKALAIAFVEAEKGVYADGTTSPDRWYDPPGKNRIQTYQSATGAYGAAWCASFVTWCFKQAGRNISGFNTAYCPSWIATSELNNGLGAFNVCALFKSDKSARPDYKIGLREIQQRVRPGDIALFDWGEEFESQGQDQVADHIGIVEYAPSRDGYFVCIEGNSTKGNRVGVQRQRRPVSRVLGWARVR